MSRFIVYIFWLPVRFPQACNTEYKSYDPRAKIVKKLAYEVFDVVGKEPIIELALELDQIALSDEYFISRKLYHNVDFYSGAIYKAMGFPTDMFVILFTIPRCSGWMAHWLIKGWISFIIYIKKLI